VLALKPEIESHEKYYFYFFIYCCKFCLENRTKDQPKTNRGPTEDLAQSYAEPALCAGQSESTSEYRHNFRSLPQPPPTRRTIPLRHLQHPPAPLKSAYRASVSNSGTVCTFRCIPTETSFVLQSPARPMALRDPSNSVPSDLVLDS
jgi:hypothetical protein